MPARCPICTQELEDANAVRRHTLVTHGGAAETAGGSWSSLPGPAGEPGWHPDPWNSTALRYWDGEGWSGRTAPLGGAPQEEAAPRKRWGGRSVAATARPPAPAPTWAPPPVATTPAATTPPTAPGYPAQGNPVGYAQPSWYPPAPEGTVLQAPAPVAPPPVGSPMDPMERPPAGDNGWSPAPPLATRPAATATAVDPWAPPPADPPPDPNGYDPWAPAPPHPRPQRLQLVGATPRRRAAGPQRLRLVGARPTVRRGGRDRR